MDIQIRKAITNDLEQINYLENSLQHRILSYDALTSTLGNSNYYYYVAITADEVIGYLVAEFMVDHFDILAIAVLNDFRLHGVAGLLLNELVNECNKLKIPDIFLEVRANNLPAIKLYEKYGFNKISCRKSYYTDTMEDAYIYKKMV